MSIRWKDVSCLMTVLDGTGYNCTLSEESSPLRTEDGPFPESGIKTPEFLDWNQKVRMCLAVNVVQVGDGASSSRTDGFR